MSEGNGDGSGDIIRIGRKGRRKVAIGNGEPIEIDVVAVGNAWADVDRQFRDEKGEVPATRQQEINAAAHHFVMDLFHDDSLSLTESLEFLAVVTKETEKLKPFFELGSGAGPSSPGPTALTFSTDP